MLSPGCDVIAVVKANAYGHGAIETSRTLIRHGVTRLAVFSTEEGVALRQADITVPIVILGPIFQEQFGDLFARQLTPVVSDPSVLMALGQAAASREVSHSIHLKIETGMGRLGLTQDELVALIRSYKFPSSLRLEGLMTHLADADGSDPDATEEQISRFHLALNVVLEGGFQVPLIHMCNSGGAVRFPSAHFSLVRPGIMLYGATPFDQPQSVADRLQPVMTLESKVICVRDLPAGEPVGYGGAFVADHNMHCLSCH